MARAQGARAQMALAFETVYGTPPGSGFTQMPFITSSLAAEQPLLASELLGYLHGAPRIDGNPWVITGTLPGKPLSDLQPFWQRVRARAGVKDVRIHDLRHTFASAAVASGQGLPMIGKLLGHTQVQTTARYAHLAAEPVKVAADAVAQNLQQALGYARNAKIHGTDQVAKIAASMAKFGWTVPCLVADDGELIAGHGRVLAAAMLGLKDVPVIRLSHLDEAERRAYRIADNKLTELGEWDEAMLRDEIAGLLDEDFDLSLLGITDEDLDALLRDPDQVEGGAVEGEDDIPEPPVTPVSVAGDLWQLGSHRLICGDSTSADVVGRLLGDVRPLLMVTDPPYGVEYDPSWRNQAGAAKTKRTGKVLNDDRADWREAWALFPGDVAYVWHGALHATTVAESLVAAGFAVRSQIIWAKDRLVLSRGDYHWQHEPCWYAVKKTGKGHWAGDRKQTTLWHISGKDQDAATVHGTQKPVECMRRPMLNNSSPGQAVFEPFMGSGTTLIAAETIGRVCFGIELNPAYVDVAIERWQQFTGADAVLSETGETFADLKAKRLTA